MYNLLIVDDEKIIREGLFELLSIEEKLELNLFSAPSAIEALSILEERKIDIVLTDIQMPRMTGIELYDAIRDRWPHCKVIFLTGYSDFDYVYKVHKHARYVLKAEEDEKIIEAINEAIEDIENDFMVERIVQDSTLLLKQRKDLEKAGFLYDLFNGFIDTSAISAELFERLEIDLDTEDKIYYLIMRHDPVVRDSYDEQIKILGDLQILLENYFFDFMKGISFDFTKNYIVLLLQPIKWDSIERNVLTLKGKSELFQKACLKNFDMNISVIIGAKPLSFDKILEDFHSVKTGLLMGGEEALLIRDDGEEKNPEDDPSTEQMRNQIKSKLELLDYYFDNSNSDHIVALLHGALGLFPDSSEMDDLFAVEIYSDVASKLIKYINRFELTLEVRNRIDLDNLYNITAHSSWNEAFNYLISVSESIFELNRTNKDRNNDDVVNRVKKYIQENLSGDTSLDALAGLAGLSPEYLLRLFKKSENITILQYINDLKIIKAKKLIEDRDLQIKEIAYELGFSSSGYFGRFFKSKTGLSPQGYRDQLE